MGEKQEKVFVVVRYASGVEDKPIKVFDDRKDARAYCKRYNLASKKYGYTYYGVLKG